MDEYIAEIDSLEVNGHKMTDFKSVTPKGVKFRKTVELMGRTGTAKITKRFAFSIEYVVPSGRPEFNWESLDNGTVAFNYPDGRRDVYLGATALEVGDGKIDGATELTKNIEIVANEMRTE